MRISTDKRDKGHRFDIDLRRVRVYLDGKLFTRAVTADEEEGLIVAMRHDAAGSPVVNDERTGYVLETLRGRVRIEVLGDDGASIRDPKVKVERVDGAVQVMVYSRIRSGNIRRMTLDADRLAGMSEEKLVSWCDAAAGAAGEHLCEQFGDVFDPSAVAAAGRQAAEQLLAREGQATRH